MNKYIIINTVLLFLLLILLIPIRPKESYITSTYHKMLLEDKSEEQRPYSDYPRYYFYVRELGSVPVSGAVYHSNDFNPGDVIWVKKNFHYDKNNNLIQIDIELFTLDEYSGKETNEEW